MGDETKRFSQDEVNGMLAKARKQHATEVAQLRNELAQRTSELDAEQARAAELQTASESREQEIAELQQQHVLLIAEHRQDRINRACGAALEAARVHPSGRRLALAELLATADIEQSEAGDVVAISVKGQRFTDHVKAVTAFLEDYPCFAPPAIGGSGGPRSALGGAAAPPFEITKADPAALANAGWLQTPNR